MVGLSVRCAYPVGTGREYFSAQVFHRLQIKSLCEKQNTNRTVAPRRINYSDQTAPALIILLFSCKHVSLQMLIYGPLFVRLFLSRMTMVAPWSLTPCRTLTQ